MATRGFNHHAVTKGRASVQGSGERRSVEALRASLGGGGSSYRTTRRALWLLSCVLLTVGCARQAPVRNPQPLVAAASPDLTEQAILDVLPRRRWTAEQVEPGRVVAFLPVKSYLLRVAITYDAQQVQIAYLSSDNLGERPGPNGEPYVHPNANKWMQKLASDISRSLARQARVTVLPQAAPAPLPVESASPEGGYEAPAQPLEPVSAPQE